MTGLLLIKVLSTCILQLNIRLSALTASLNLLGLEAENLHIVQISAIIAESCKICIEKMIFSIIRLVVVSKSPLALFSIIFVAWIIG